MSDARVTFQVTTYYKRRRGQPGLTRIASRRLDLATALKWIVDELPEEAVDAAYDAAADTGSYTIRWALVPDEVKDGLGKLPMSTEHVVLLACGHWLREGRAGTPQAGARPPARACQRDGHREGWFAALYAGDLDLSALWPEDGARERA